MDKEKNRIIEISQLRNLINSIFDNLELNNGGEIVIESDYYHHINIQEAFDFLDKTPEYQVGSLYDELDFIITALQDQSPPSLVLDYIASYLRYIAYRELV